MPTIPAPCDTRPVRRSTFETIISGQSDIERARTLGRNRGLIRPDEYSEDEFRIEIVRRFGDRQAVAAGIEQFRAARAILAPVSR